MISESFKSKWFLHVRLPLIDSYKNEKGFLNKLIWVLTNTYDIFYTKSHLFSVMISWKKLIS